MSEAHIRVGNWMMTTAMADKGPFPPEVLAELQALLTYSSTTYVQPKPGPRGSYQQAKFDTSEYRQWALTEDHRFVCQYGAMPEVRRILESHGIGVRVFRNRKEIPDPVSGPYVPDWDMLSRRMTFRPRQEEALNAILSHDGGIIDAVTAFGKAYVITMVPTAQPRARVLVTTKSIQVADSLYRVLTRFLTDVSIVHSKSRQGADARVVVCTAGSLDNIPNNFDYLLADEVHELVTDNFASKLARFTRGKRFGFTASKETRSDGHYHRLLPMFGPTIFKITFPEAVSLGLTVPVHVIWIHPEGLRWPSNPDPGPDYHFSTRKKRTIWEHDYRNDLWADALSAVADEGLQTLVSCSTMEHALHLKQRLPDFTLVYATGDMPAARRKKFAASGLPVDEVPTMTSDLMAEYKSRFESRDLMRVIMTPVWSVGVSFDSLEVVGRSDGTVSETASIQLPGRVCRTHDLRGKDAGILLDCWDSFSPSGTRKSESKSLFYHSLGWTQSSWLGGEPWSSYFPKLNSAPVQVPASA